MKPQLKWQNGQKPEATGNANVNGNVNVNASEWKWLLKLPAATILSLHQRTQSIPGTHTPPLRKMMATICQWLR